MALPVIDKPIFTIKAPTDGREIKYKPYSVKEEKILLIAQQSNDSKQSLLATKQVLNNCIIDEDVDKMAMIDVEYTLLAIRSKSVGSIIELMIKDGNKDAKVKVEMNLDNVSIIRDENHSNMIKLNDTYTLVMRYPTINESFLLIEADTPEKRAMANFEIMKRCLYQIVSEDDVFSFDDETSEAIDTWLDDIDSATKNKLNAFFDTSPVIRYEFPFKNSAGEERTIVIQGIDSFFK